MIGEETVVCSGYVLRFDIPSILGNKYTLESIDIESFENMKKLGHIIDYEIDDVGVIVTQRFPKNLITDSI